jgi:hypothetical protein
MRVIAAALAIFAAYLPIALWVGSLHTPAPRPAGKAVETILRFDLDHPDRYVARSYIFGPAKYPDPSQIRVYEDVTPLPGKAVQFTADEQAYVIRFKTSDGTDPRTNGRQYWLVLP